VVPDLRRVVEDAGLVGLAGRRLDDGLERLAFELPALDEVVEVVDVGLVVLAVVESQRVGGDDRGERAFGEGQGR
jgi:hypothetical protein